MALRKLIALRDFSLGIFAERNNWSGPDPKKPRHVPLGFIFDIGESAQEQHDAAQLIWCGAAGDGESELRIKAVQKGIEAMNDPEVRKTLDAMLYGKFESDQQAVRLRGELQETTKELQKEKQTATQAQQALEKAQEAASLTLTEAVEKWNHLEMPNTTAKTTAQIKQAVTLYLTDPNKRSLKKIAAEFRVTPQRVSQWFHEFTAATGLRVITHKKHESVRDHIETDRKRRQNNGDNADQGQI